MTELRRTLTFKLYMSNLKKVKFSLCLIKYHTMKTYWGSGGTFTRNLDLGTRWRWVVSFTLPLLQPQGKSPWYPLDRRLGVSV